MIKEGRAYTKVIKMVKSPKTGAYVFDEQIYIDNRIHSANRERKNKPGRVSHLSQTNVDDVLPSHPHTLIQSLYSSVFQV